MAKIIKCIAVVTFALSVIFSILNAIFDSAVWLFLTITFATVTYHFGMRLFVGFVFDRIMNNKVDYNRKWFQVSPAEIRFYNAIKVKRWKIECQPMTQSCFQLKIIPGMRLYRQCVRQN